MSEQTKFQLRCSVAQLALWRDASARIGWPVSEWIRRACDESAALERAVASEDAARAAGATVPADGWVMPTFGPGGVDLAGKFKPDPRRR